MPRRAIQECLVLPIGISAPPTQRKPYVTVGVSVTCIAVFVRLLLLQDAPQALYCTDLTESAQAAARASGTVQAAVCRFGVIPDHIWKAQDLSALVTAMFVHEHWFHLLSNLLFFLAFAPRVEEDLGHTGLTALFLGSGTLGALAHVLVAPSSTVPSIGASGAVAGVLGAHLLLSKGARVRVLIGPVPVRLPSRFVILLWISLQLFYAALLLRRAVYNSGTSYEAHVVGFLLGLAYVVGHRARRGAWRSSRRERDAG